MGLYYRVWTIGLVITAAGWFILRGESMLIWWGQRAEIVLLYALAYGVVGGFVLLAVTLVRHAVFRSCRTVFSVCTEHWAYVVLALIVVALFLTINNLRIPPERGYTLYPPGTEIPPRPSR